MWAHVKTGWRVAAAWCMDLFARPSGKALVWGARGVAVAGVLWFLGVAVSDSLKPTTWTDVAGSSDAPARTSDSKPLSKAPPANNASIDVTQRSLPQSAKAQSERPQLASAQTAAQSGPDTTVTGRSVSVARDIDTKNTASFAESTASAHAIELLERERKSVQTLMTELERIRAENAKLKAAQLAEQATTNITQDIATVPAAVVNAAAARETRAEDIAYQQHQAHTESVSQTHIVVRNQAEEPLPVAQQLEQRDDLEALLSRADTLRAEEQLTVPPENNALTAYRDALEMSPGDPRALAGIADIKRQFLTWADEAKVQGDVAKAKRHYRKALFVDPHDEEISVLLAELVDATGDARTASVQVENQAIALRVSDSVASYSGRAVEQDSEADAVATNVNLNAVNARGETVLHLAARAGNTIETRRLLKAGADPDHANEAGDTSLFHAAWNNHLDVASALIEAGATVRNRNSDGWTPLIYASINGHTRLVKLLLSNGADVDAMNHEGQTALAAAAWNGHSKTALTLISANANLDLKDRDGWTALMKAAWNGYDEIVKVLLENGANPTLRTPAGETARKLASNSGHSTAAALLRLP